MRPCAGSADRHRLLLKLAVQDVSCAESADRHRQLLKLAVQDVYVRQHARSAPTQISAQCTPNHLCMCVCVCVCVAYIHNHYRTLKGALPSRRTRT